MKRDAANFAASPLLNGRFSFGGNGAPNPNEQAPYYTSAGGPITTGPFAGEIIHVAMGNETLPAHRPIQRNIAQFYADMWLRPEREVELLSETDFDQFSLIMEGKMQLSFVFYADQWGIHSAGHRALGGDMVDTWTSPSDPLFYMHHSNLDRIWATWQKENPEERQFLVGGPIKPRSPLLGPWPYPPPPGNVTLDYVMSLNNLGGNTEVSRVIDTMGKVPAGSPSGILCYQYDSLL
jgi:tyrosinase